MKHVEQYGASRKGNRVKSEGRVNETGEKTRIVKEKRLEKETVILTK